MERKGIPYWWKLVAVFTIGWVLMYADRTILNPVMPNIGKEFDLNNAQLGLINSVFFITYAIAQIPSGSLGDRYGRKLILVPGFILFGIFTWLSGLVTTFLAFMIARAMTGLFEGTYFGPQYGLSSETIPTKNLAVGTAIINSGMALGTSLGYISSSYLTLELGMNWRTPFYFMAIPTIIVGILIWFVIKEDRNRLTVTQKENNVNKQSVGKILKNKNLVVTFIMVFCSLYGFFMILTWLPQFLQLERGFQGHQVGFISSLIPWASIPGAILFAYLCDKFGKRKRFVFFLVPIAAISIYSVAQVESTLLLVIALLVYGFFGKLALDPVLLSFVAKNAPKESYGFVYSFYNFIGMLSSILAPYITGYLVDKTGSMQSGFYLAIILLGIGFIAMMLANDKPDHETKINEPRIA